MSNQRIAHRYAKPLLELAIEMKCLEEVRNDLSNFSQICQTNREFLLFLKSPIISHFKKAEVLTTIFENKYNHLTLSLFAIMARKNREALLHEMAESFLILYNENKGLSEVLITTSTPISSLLKSEFEKMILQVANRKALIKEKIDPSIIGGFKVRIGDKQIDASVSGKLRTLRYTFEKENTKNNSPQ